MANKISVLIDVATDKATSGLKGFKASINDADGALGKMKAGASSAFDSIKANAGNLAMAAGAALVTLGVKAVGAFQDAALAAGNFADATGLSAEEASRWVAVADDIGISGEAMEKSFGKLAVAIGKNNPLLEQYGITVIKAADGTVDMNATMLNAVDVIKGIKDPTEKAAVAQAALGKGWIDMAELIEQGSGSLTESMAEVSEAQVIDEAEVEKARKMRESMDTLQDAVSDLALVWGEEMVPAAAAAADALAAIIGPMSDLNEWMTNATRSALEFVGIIDKVSTATGPAITGIGHMGTALDAQASSGDTVAVVMAGVTEAIDVGRDATRDAAEATAGLTAENMLLADAIKRTTDRYRDLKGELSAEEAFHDAVGMFQELQASAVEAMTAAETGADNASQAMFDHQGNVIAAKQSVVELGEKYADLPEEEITKIVALIDEGSLEEAERRFNILARNREMNVTVIERGSVGYGGGFGGHQASGGPVDAGVSYLVGEQGTEMFMPAVNGYIVPHSALAGGWAGGSGAGSGDTYAATVNNNGRDVTVADVGRALTLARLSR